MEAWIMNSPDSFSKKPKILAVVNITENILLSHILFS